MKQIWSLVFWTILMILGDFSHASAQKRLFNSAFLSSGAEYSLAVIPLRADDEVRSDSVVSQMFANSIDPNVMYDTHSIRWALYKDQMANAIVSRLSGVSYANNELNAFPSIFEVLSPYEVEHLWATLAYADFVLVPAKCEYRITPMSGQFYCNISYEVRLYHLYDGEMVLVMRDDIGATGPTEEAAAASAERNFVKEMTGFIQSRL